MTQSNPVSDGGAPRVNDVAVIGLGVMGANLARNFASRGFRVAGYTRDPDGRDRFRAEEAERTASNGGAIDVADSLPELVARLERPRRIVLMVTAGAAVDAVLDALDPLLEEGDIAVDGGNSLYRDTDRRARRAEGRPWRFVGMGVSGGAEGALRGPSMMPGGDPEAWRRLEPALSRVAAIGPHGPCVTYCGRRSAGHFVKMVHNGIEYGDMQLIAETATLMRDGLGMDPVRVADTFAEWNRGALESYLIDITADIFRVEDPERPGHLLVDAILDRAGQKGTGRWTVMAAVELGVPVPTIAAALDARALSAGKSIREAAEAALGGRAARGVADGQRGHVLAGIGAAELEAALYASKIASYTQGFQMLATASDELDYGIDLAEVARIWTAGCIIRARFLDRVREAYSGEPPALLALAPSFAAELRARLPAWRLVVSAATAAGFAVPGLSASLAWLDTVATARGSANLIQAQRDYFGSHTYRRTDAPDVAVHTEWAQLARARES